jgi:hypothetical protein
VAAHLLQEQRQFDGPEAEPARRLGHGERRPALLDHGRPQPVVDAATGVDHRPHLRRRRPAVEQRTGGVPQRDLIVRELEIHVRTIASPWT